MRSLLFIFVLFPTISFGQCLRMDIVILADMSGSVEDHEGYIADAMLHIVNKFDLSESTIRIGITTFAGMPVVEQALTKDTKALQLATQRIRVSKAEGSTSITLALLGAANELISSRFNVDKLIILISDGDANSLTYAIKASETVKSYGIYISSILVNGTYAEREFLKRISTEGMYVETRYKNLIRAIEKMSICF